MPSFISKGMTVFNSWPTPYLQLSMMVAASFSEVVFPSAESQTWEREWYSNVHFRALWTSHAGQRFTLHRNNCAHIPAKIIKDWLEESVSVLKLKIRLDATFPKESEIGWDSTSSSTRMKIDKISKDKWKKLLRKRRARLVRSLWKGLRLQLLPWGLRKVLNSGGG